MATVYQAEHVHFQEICALKVINPIMMHDEAWWNASCGKPFSPAVSTIPMRSGLTILIAPKTVPPSW